MARLFTAGFELQSVTDFMEVGAMAGTAAISTTTFRSGLASLEIGSLVSATPEGGELRFSASNLTVIYTRAYLRITTLPSAENRIIVHSTSPSGTGLVYLTLDNSGILRLYDEDGQITGTTTLSTGIWYRIETHIDVSGAGGTHTVEARVDGAAVFASSTTRSVSAGIVEFAVGGNLASEAQTTGLWHFDDCAVNDTSLSAQTSWPGEGKVVHMQPDAAGDNALWGRGGTDSGSDFGQVDEITPNDATDYLIGDATNDIIDLNMESSTSAGIGSSDTITLVEVLARCRAATAALMTYNTRFKTQASGTLSNGTLVGIDVTAWWTGDNAAPQHNRHTVYTDPQAGGPLTPALLDTSQIGAIVTDANPDCWMSTIWLLVEYVPAVPKSLPLFRRVRRIVTRRR